VKKVKKFFKKIQKKIFVFERILVQSQEPEAGNSQTAEPLTTMGKDEMVLNFVDF